MQVLASQEPLSERGEGNAANAFFFQSVEQFSLDPAVEHVVRG